MKRAIDMAYVSKRKYDLCQAVCAMVVRMLYVLAALCLIHGIFRPLFLDEVTIWSVWASMLLEASAYGVFKTARWVVRNAL